MDQDSNPLISFKNDIQFFFTGVDSCVSSHVRPDGIGFGEVACTELMAMCLSPNDPPPSLGFTGSQLSTHINERLCELGVDATFKTTFSFTKFSQNHEGAVTQSDFAIRIIASDSSDPRRLSREQIYFFQAKILKEGCRYELSANQKWRIDKLRRLVGDGRLLYCLYNPMEQGVGITAAPGHPTTMSQQHFSWSHFMTQLLVASQSVGATGRQFAKQAEWRRLLIESNGVANNKIATLLGTEAKNWVPYEPAVMTFEADFPAYEYRRTLAHTVSASPSAATVPGHGSSRPK